jgi:amino acid permease
MPKLTTIIDIAVAVKCFGVATSYLIVIGDLMPEVMEQMGAAEAATSRLLWVAVGFSIVAPLSFLKDLDSLKFTSLVSIFFVGFLTFLIMLYATDAEGLDPCADVDDECVGDKHDFLFDIGTMKVFSIFVFGFTCHQVFIMHYVALKQRFLFELLFLDTEYFCGEE